MQPERAPPAILIVDDDARNLLALDVALSDLDDCTLVEAHSGREALKCLLGQEFAVIVIDVNMPDMNGFETASLIRDRRQSQSTPIIFVTADRDDVEQVLEGYRLGAIDYIHTPFEPTIVRSKVRFFVELFRKSATLQQRTAELSTMAAELERSEEHFRALIENASDLIMIVELNTTIRYASPSVERTLGYPREQMAGQRVLDFVHFDDSATLESELTRLAEVAGSSPPTTRRWRHVDGSFRMLEATATNLLRTTSVAGLVVHARDVTERKQAEAQVQALNANAQSEKLRALGQMATGIAHDLNQSLMLIASYSDLARQALLQQPANLAELEILLATTTQAALDGGESVKRLLLFTRGRTEHEVELVELASLVREAAQLAAPRWRDAPQAEGRPVTLDIQADNPPTYIHGSPAGLREMLTNLIFNAVDALPSGGTISLRVTAENEQAIIEVIDSGVGMSAEVREHLFEPFFTTKGASGTGLGLAMVFGIVEQHAGHVGVDSTPGQGTTIRVAFPMVSANAQADPTVAAQLESLVPLRILTVDDEPMMTRAVVRMLKSSAHVVSVAGSGEEALDMLVEQEFDVVISDLGMGGGMNGWELAEMVKRRWPSIRFLLATGWGAAIDPSEALARGVEQVLSKPYRPADLLRALAHTEAAA